VDKKLIFCFVLLQKLKNDPEISDRMKKILKLGVPKGSLEAQLTSFPQIRWRISVSSRSYFLRLMMMNYLPLVPRSGVSWHVESGQSTRHYRY
jgi:hypothetical protein